MIFLLPLIFKFNIFFDSLWCRFFCLAAPQLSWCVVPGLKLYYLSPVFSTSFCKLYSLHHDAFIWLQPESRLQSEALSGAQLNPELTSPQYWHSAWMIKLSVKNLLQGRKKPKALSFRRQLFQASNARGTHTAKYQKTFFVLFYEPLPKVVGLEDFILTNPGFCWCKPMSNVERASY